ncbi:MAG: DUF3303 domain-containing protein [Candidatus Hodarchaeota archaeon]
MKYIAFFELDPEDFEKVIEKYRQGLAEIEKGTEKYPKPLSEPYGMGGEFKGFQLYETDNPEQLVNLALYYAPEMKHKFVPIFEVAKVIELYQKTKQ